MYVKKLMKTTIMPMVYWHRWQKDTHTHPAHRFIVRPFGGVLGSSSIVSFPITHVQLYNQAKATKYNHLFIWTRKLNLVQQQILSNFILLSKCWTVVLWWRYDITFPHHLLLESEIQILVYMVGLLLLLPPLPPLILILPFELDRSLSPFSLSLTLVRLTPRTHMPTHPHTLYIRGFLSLCLRICLRFVSFLLTM